MAPGDRRRFSGFLRLRPGERVEGRFGLLLVLLVASFLLVGFTEEGWAPWATALVELALLVVAFKGTRLRQNLPAIAAVGGVGVAIIVIGTSFSDGDAQLGLLAVGSFLLFAAIMVGVLDRVTRHPVVTVQTILGAISVYFLLGLIFSSIFAFLDATGSEPLFGESVSESVYSYFSFVTMTTVGYGDYTAHTDVGRRVAVIQAMFGQVYLAVLVARLVSMYKGPSRVREDATEGS